MTAAPRRFLLALALLASGTAGLVYEVVWSRYLALLVGSTGRGHLIILSTFMGGLALGALWLGRRADRMRNAFLFYALVEVGIALAGALYPAMFGPLRALFLGAASVLGGGGAAIGAASTLVAVASILPGAVLMGATTPVLLRGAVRDDESVGRTIAVFYFLNSLGAVAGALWAGLWAVPELGLAGASHAAAALNVLAGLCALLLARGAEPVPPRDDPAPVPGDARAARIVRLALVVAGASGFISFVYEVAWIRMLTLVLGSATHSFPLMLGAFILGIALGSLALSMRRAPGGWEGVLAWSQLLIGGTALLSLCWYEHLPIAVNRVRMAIVRDESNYPLFLALQFGLCIAAMLLPTFAMGLSFPAAARLVASRATEAGRSYGRLVAINTAGTVLGAIVGGAVILPLIGIKHTIELASAASLLLGVLVIHRALGEAARPVLLRATAFIIAVALAYGALAPEWDPRLLTSGLYREKRRIESLDEARAALEARQVIYYRDGVDATIAVVLQNNARSDGVPVVALIINGKVDASSDFDMQTQLLAGHVPMMIHPDPRDVLVVGLGAGVTAGAVLAGGAESIECVELIPEIVGAAEKFSVQNYDVLRSPRFTLRIGDAKTHLLLPGKSYDVIINEPTNLWVAGVPGLFTIEHLTAASRRLKPGGIYLQWVHTYEMQDRTLFRLLSTFQRVFPHSTMFNVGGDLIIAGSLEPFSPDFGRMEEYFARPPVREQLQAFGMYGLAPILSLQTLSKEGSAAPIVPDRGVCSDFKPDLDYECAKGFFLDASTAAAGILDRRFYSPSRAELWIGRWPHPVWPDDRGFREFQSNIERFTSTFAGLDAAWAHLWLQRHPASREARRTAARFDAALPGAELPVYDGTPEEESREATAMRAGPLYLSYARQRNFLWMPDSSRLRVELERLAGMNSPESAWALAVLGDLEFDAGRPHEALALYARSIEAARPPQREPSLTPPVGPEALLLRVAEAKLAAGDLAGARAAAAQLPMPKDPPPVPTPRELFECRLAHHEELARRAAKP